VRCPRVFTGNELIPQMVFIDTENYLRRERFLKGILIFTSQPARPQAVTYWDPTDISSDREEQNHEVYDMASISYLAHAGPHG
jgi:hypothetical protein